MKAQEIVPPDVQAYMLQAVKRITTDQGVTFNSEEEARKWLDSNFTIVCLSALEQMQSMRSKVLDNPNIMDEVSRHICRRVYDSIPKDAEPRFQQRYIDYASARQDARGATGIRWARQHGQFYLLGRP